MSDLEARTITVEEVAERLPREKRVLVVTHESPDGDALGSLVALRLVAERLGIATDAYIPGDTRFPDEYCFLPRLDGILRGEPPGVDPETTTIYLLDCASLLRSHGDRMQPGVVRVNIDHHQDNPGYAELNLLAIDAASTTAILYDIFKAGGFAIDEAVATALYVGLVTDTGRFQYSNTTPAAHRTAADLVAAGVKVGFVNRSLYESAPLPKLLLLRQALSHLEVRLGGRLVMAWVGNDDFIAAGADGSHTEGIIDHLRAVQGVRVAVFVRKRLSLNGPPECKVSLRSTDDTVDVADIAGRRGGGGHIRAAGFTCTGEMGEIVDWLENEVRVRL